MIRCILFFGVLLGLIGCAQTTSTYYYISLEHEKNIKILKRGKLQLKYLENNSEIPIQYLLARDRYTIRFIIGDKSYYPHVKVVVENSKGEKFIIKPRRDIGIISSEGTICASYYLDKNSLTEMAFGWSVNCLSESIKKEISFSVIDKSGTVISNEDVIFTLAKDGQYTLLDAL